MKFGGTSVADRSGRDALARRVEGAINAGRAPVVVVSAMGRAGAPYATDTLLGLLGDLPSDERERDLIASTGEMVSAVLVAHELRAHAIPAVALTGAEAGIRTDGAHGRAAINEVDTAALRHLLGEGRVPVVAGFQGSSPDGSTATLGRGGSDTTACALGVALGAQTVEIYTDVDGVMSADPRACNSAGVVEVIGADELFQMARHGSRVVHTPAAELALASGLGVRVRNTFSDAEGTLVVDLSAYRPSEVATAVSHAEGIARVTVPLAAPEGSDEHMAAQTRVYRAMADAGVSLDMFTPVADALVFTVPEGLVARACAILTGLGFDTRVRGGLAKVTLIGAGMHGVPGVMAQAAEHLAAAGVHVLQTADSHTTISVLVPAEDALPAVTALHDGFGLGRGDRAC
jgi:aspartate kinase